MKSPKCRSSVIGFLTAMTILTFAAVDDVQAATIVCFPMDTNPGWSTQGQWAFGVPLGGGSHCGDPTSGHTGTNVYGYNLSGDYTNNMPAYYLTTTAMDCFGYENVTLRFWRWLGIESSSYDHAKIEVSNNGNTWVTVWNHSGGSFCDGAWIECVYDISAVADDQSTVYIRWTMGPTDGSVTYPGWNIDDVCLLGDCIDDLSITPSENFITSGEEGGPFLPGSKTYTLTNGGANSLDWTATVSETWLDVTLGGGTLGPGDSNTVTVYLTADVNTLLPGDYNDTVSFTNTASGFIQTRAVTLEVIPGPAEIEVTDSIPSVDDLNMPFGDVIIGLPRTEQVTISNTDPDYSLVVTDVSLLSSTSETDDLLIELPDIAGGPIDVNSLYLPDGWVAPDRPDSDLIVESGYRKLTTSADVLLLASGNDPTVLRLALNAFPDIDTVDYFDCSSAAPTGSDLAPYDVVVVMSNAPLYNAVQTGDVLADYVDAGGRIIQAVATFAYGGGWELQGRFVTQEGYESFVHGDAEFFAHSLGDFDHSHPIMDGITALTDELVVGVDLEPDAEWVADWNNDTPLVATQDSGVVGINIFAFNEGNYTGDVPLLFHNAIVWLLEAEVETKGFGLIGVPEPPIVIPPLDSITFDVNFNPTEVKDYERRLVISSTDPNNPEVEVWLSGCGILDYLEITPDANFVFSGHPGGPFVPSNTSYQLTNIGPNTIDWVIDSSVVWLDVSPAGGTLSPGGSVSVIVAPNAQADAMPEGYHCETANFLDITSTLNQRRTICLNVYTEPKIWVSPYSFDVTIPQGSNDVQILTIGNTGGSALDFTLSSYKTGFMPPLDQGLAAAVTQVETEDKIVLEYEFSEPIVTTSTETEYDLVQIEGLKEYRRTGAPIIPVRPVTVLIPYGKEVVTTRVMSFDTRQLEGTYQLPPAQEPYPLSYQDTVEPTEPDPAIYGQATPWPGVDHEEVAAQSKRGYQLFVVNLFPLQYVPKTGKISYAGKLRLEIDLVDAPLGVLRPSDTVKAELSAAVDNLTVLEAYPESDNSLETLGQFTALPPGGPYQYVIITNEALEAVPGSWNFQALRDAKIACGMTATIVTTQWIYANYEGTKPNGGSDNQTRIRNFLIDAYQTWGTEYVLLGGTNGIVPARFFLVDSLVGDIEMMPVDMYYGCVEPAACTFDYDADGYYGEPTDGVGGGDVDLYAEIYVGRAAVENATELHNFVMKTLTYDSRSNVEYLPRISMVGEYLGFGGVAEYAKDSMEQIRLGGEYDGYFTYGFKNHIQPYYYDFNTVGCLPEEPDRCWPLYDKDYDWPKSDLINLMNGGIHIFNHLGHADYTYDMKLYVSDLASLTNMDYFFAYSQGCMPGGFDTTNCFAEVITSMEHGAFAVVMNARSGWGQFYSTDGPSNRFDRQFWDAVLGEGILEIGRANQDSKEDNLWDINGECIRWCYYELNLFGDPAQRLQFTKSGDSSGWMDLVPCSGIVAPGGTADVNVIFDANQPAGTYTGGITVYSNDPYTPELTIPVTMNVEPVDYFTELFEPEIPFSPNDPNNNDMAYRTLTFKPGGADYYKACVDEAGDFPVDPNGGTIVSLGDDDYVPVNLIDKSVNLYGTAYRTFYIGSNGYVSFISGDIRYLETLEDHFDLPRISALFDDLDPSAGGLISWKLLDDKVVVTFEDVPEYNTSNTNSFQIEMRFNGKIRITWLGIDAYDGLVGLSEGCGSPLYFSESDMCGYGVCNFICDLNCDFDTDFEDFAVLASHWCEPHEVTKTETVFDEFNYVSYSGNDGTQNWSNDWQEIGESDGPSNGDVLVSDDLKSLRIGRFAEGRGLVREADLSEAISAVLTFDWWYDGPYYKNNTTVDVSNDGGANWTTLLAVPDGRDSSLHSESFDVFDYVAPEIQIRFIANSRGNGYIYFDNVQIEYDVLRVNDFWCDECDLNDDFSIDTFDLCILAEHWLD